MSGTKLIKRNNGTATKSKNIGSPIVPRLRLDADGNYSLIQKFLTSTSAEDQLGTLRNILDEFKESNDEKVTLFLAAVFYEAPAKHPIKCFLTRHITKCANIHNSFTRSLTSYIDAEIRNHNNKYEYNFYKRNIPKLMMCTENFLPGANAVENLDVKFLIQRVFVDYFVNARNDNRGNLTLSPTEKNEQFSLEHVMLRLLVYVLQNISVDESNQQEYHHCFENITECAKTLIFDEEVPMDTKSLAGILVLHIESIVSSWQDACNSVLSGQGTFPATRTLVTALAGRLVLLCALASATPLSALTPYRAGEEHPMLTLVDQLLPFADGSAGSGDVTVCVARALVALASRTLIEPATPTTADASTAPTEPAAPAALATRLLAFVWGHLEHTLDAVRHLARTLLAQCLQYVAREEKRGGLINSKEDTPLQSLLSSLRALGPSRSLYWSVAAACGVLGASRVLADLVTPAQLLQAAAQPHLHAAATAAIAAVLNSGACEGLPPNVVFDTWVCGALESPAALQAVLPPATDACPQLPEYINNEVHGRALLECARACSACCVPLAHRTLRAHAIHQDNESRILVVSLLCERERATEIASREDLATMLWVLHYNLASPRPAFRTALLHYFNKLLKRLEDSSRAANKRGEGVECLHYRPFLQRGKQLAVGGAGQGAAPARRATALQLLASLAPHMDGEWVAEDVVTLLQALDDSYDGNKELALRALAHCPTDILEHSCPFSLSDVVCGARSARAAHGAAAAAKLCLLLDRLPHTLAPTADSVGDIDSMGVEERAYYSAAVAVHTALVAWRACKLRAEAARGGAHGTLRCVRALLQRAHNRRASWRSNAWPSLHGRLLDATLEACARAEPAVCSQAPEGFLPPCSPGELKEEEAQVTAQMVLVCAWRTIKEGAAVVSLLGPLVPAQVCLEAGTYLVGLLTRARHRGAVDQAAEGLLALAQQCWLDVERAAYPRRWLAELLALVSGSAPHATRRGAGFTAAIQALVSSEVTATGRADCFEDCMKKLLQIATARDAQNTFQDTHNDAPDTRNDTPDTHNGVPVTQNTQNDALNTEGGDSSSNLPEDVARRTLAANILRALYRHSALDRASQPFVSDGLKLALNGFEAAAWPERTAMSLLFCALSVRVFGVVRARGGLHARNTLPAHVLCARYPGIYHLMLSKLAGCGSGVGTGPAVLPVLLILERIYSTPATPATLQMWRFVPLVQRCACASDLRVRRLAARALPALLPRDQQLPYMKKLLAAVSNPNLQRIHWHGALLTLSSLIERAPCSDPMGVTLSANDTLGRDCDTLGGDCDTLEGYSTRDEVNNQEIPSKSYYSSPKSLEKSFKAAEMLSNTSKISTNLTKPFDQTKKKSNNTSDANNSNDTTDTWARSNDAEKLNSLERSNTAQRSTVTLVGYTPVGSLVLDSLCALIQATGKRPCYVIAREYCNVLNLLVWKHPCMVGADIAVKAMRYLDTMLFHGTTDFGADRELCLADCLLLYLVLLQRFGRVSEITSLIIRALSHPTYEVCLAACDFLLIQQDKLEDDPCPIRQHLTAIRNTALLQTLRTSDLYRTYLNILANITNDTNHYQECRLKSLRLLTLENDTQLLVIRETLPFEHQNEENIRLRIVSKLIQNIQEDNLTKHMYLQSLLLYMKGKMVHLGYSHAIDVLEIVYECSSSQNTVECRSALISYFESDLEHIIEITWEKQPPEIMFQYKALIMSTLVTLLEDDDNDIRQRASDVIARMICPLRLDVTSHGEDALLADAYDVTTSLPLLKQAVRDNFSRDVTPAASGALLRARLQTEQDGCALLLLLALLDFRAEVCLTDARDESRIFDQSERYNVLLEESVWTTTCADILIQMNTNETDLLKYSLTIIHDKIYSQTFQYLCQENLRLFERMTNGELVAKDETLNTKIEVLVNKFRR